MVEQILASHSQVYGAGELATMRHTLTAVQRGRAGSFPGFVPGLRRADVASLAATYVAQTSQFSGPGVSRVVDKHPLNF